jgi:hypothetical protein
MICGLPRASGQWRTLIVYYDLWLTTGIRPVATASRRKEQSGIGFLKKVSLRTQILLFLLAHGTIGDGLGTVEAEIPDNNMMIMCLIGV